MKGKLLQTAQERLDYLLDFLGRLNRAQEQVPDVQEIIEQSKWEINVLSEMPEDGEEFITDDMIKRHLNANIHLFSNLPLPPVYSTKMMYSTASISSASSSDVYEIVSRVGEIENDEFHDWSVKSVLSYRQMLEKQSRYEKIRELLMRIIPYRVAEFETARVSYLAAKADVGEREAAGISMRNVLEHFKGDLFVLARKHENENMTWERMAERLARDGVGSVEHAELSKQKAEWNSLQSRLSQVAKGQKKGLVADLDDIWTKLLDHMFTILGIIQ